MKYRIILNQKTSFFKFTHIILFFYLSQELNKYKNLQKLTKEAKEHEKKIKIKNKEFLFKLFILLSFLFYFKDIPLFFFILLITLLLKLHPNQMSK